MKTKFKARYKTVGVEGDWWETEKKDLYDETAQEWAERIISMFNKTLRVGEIERELLEVVVLEENIPDEPKYEAPITTCPICGHEHDCDDWP